MPVTRRKAVVAGLVAGLAAVAVVAGVLATRGDVSETIPELGSPVGKPVLPDLMPKPQLNVTTGQVDGRWHIFFSSIVVNVGKGDFLLRGTRKEGLAWQIDQDIPHTQGGAKRVPTRATVAWGGDGHEHWHILRVASVWLVALGKDGQPVNDSRDRIDTKVGFCFYDHTHELLRGPEKAVYSAHSCADEGDTELGMGLSPGWNDTYRQSLPGQNIDVTGLRDGRYRLWTVIDQHGWFREASRKNNRTWIDLELRTTPAGRGAATLGRGPSPSPVIPR